MWAHSWLWGERKHWVARRTWVTISSWERCRFQGAGIWLMDVSKCNSGSRWPKRNRKDALLQHLVGLWLTPILACLGSSDPFICYHLRASLGEELPEFSCPWVCPWVLSGKSVLQKGLWYCSLTPVRSKHSFSTDDSGFTQPTRLSTCQMNVKNSTCKPGLEKGFINLLVAEWAERSKVDGWEASKQESRSLGTRWSLGSNPVLYTACWETSDRSLDLPVL